MQGVTKMAEFEVEVYELWTSKVAVQANSRAEAIRKVLGGQGEPVHNSSQLVETLDYGLVMGLEQENPGIIDELNALGTMVQEDDETFIKGVEEV